MATVKISFGAAMGGGAPVAASIPNAAETLTTDTTTTIQASAGDYATIQSISGAAHIDCGQSPSAGTSAGYAIADGGAISIGPLKEGDKVAILGI